MRVGAGGVVGRGDGFKVSYDADGEARRDGDGSGEDDR